MQEQRDDLSMRLLRLMGALRARFARDLARYGLTFPQYLTLCSLGRAEGQALRMGDLATATHQSAASMTGIVDRLLEGGLVERRPDPADRRSVLVALTPKGTQVLEQVRADRRHAVEDLLRSLSSQERAAFYEILGKLLAALEEGGREV
ncbi:MAG: MarR family transcriptional regulator [Thermoflexales bacterium]|nr:MarR family transcriptional regulator [Thermoflexales bacterium]